RPWSSISLDWASFAAGSAGAASAGADCCGAACWGACCWGACCCGACWPGGDQGWAWPTMPPAAPMPAPNIASPAPPPFSPAACTPRAAAWFMKDCERAPESASAFCTSLQLAGVLVVLDRDDRGLHDREAAIAGPAVVLLHRGRERLGEAHRVALDAGDAVALVGIVRVAGEGLREGADDLLEQLTARLVVHVAEVEHRRVRGDEGGGH